ncbi:FAD-dependent oxidoreductase [Sphaerochaeta sp. PS]|uniref:FAD-dependent oxidoreductase n=1 Tax=Sphaerochaeta sp. PS TaxID=3076336 RepID=UPI0028A4CC4C|nr:FAD-dependent oxidoreductase [Sphaerochaeta sp. PS]MDT4762074.1 FAD-dependent oxidoreductase [Sphaerochaeta sp. PS]
MEKKHIVILGGGYAGVHAAKNLHKAFRKMQDQVSITLIDRGKHHILMTELHEVAGNRVKQNSVKISFDRIFSGKMVNVVQDEIKDINFKDQILTGERGSYHYDQLILGTGGQTADFRIPGVKENAFYLWSLEDALAIRYHIETMVKEAAKEADADKRKQLLTFVVAGGGFTGVELVGELIEWLPVLCEKNKVDHSDVRIINCEALGSILNMLPEKPRNKAVHYMQKKGVEIMLNSLITEVTEDGFTIRGGETIMTKTLVWTCGVRGTEFGESLTITDGKMGRKLVNEYMQSPDYKNVYVVGDGMYFQEDNRPVPQIVEAAEQSAKTACDGVIYTIKTELGKKAEPPKPFKSNFHGYMVSIGGRYAVSHTAGVSMSGFFAQAMKHMVNMYYQFGVCGVNGAWTYLKHEILEIKNKRSLIGGMASYRVPSYWTTFLRMFLGVMWLIEGFGKIAEGWLTDTTGSKVYWSTAADAVGSASEAVGDAATAVAGVAAEAVKQFAPPLLAQPLALYTWINETFVSQAPYLFQIMIVLAEVGIGLCFLGGLFTFPAAIVSLGLSVMFLIGALAGKEILWYMAVSIVMLGGAGRAFGLDYWVMPYLKKLWNKTPLAKKTYLFMGEPEFTKKQMKRKLDRTQD